jgi:hypothetical protein
LRARLAGDLSPFSGAQCVFNPLTTLGITGTAAALGPRIRSQRHPQRRNGAAVTADQRPAKPLAQHQDAMYPRGVADAGDPQWSQKLVFYVVQLAVCIGAILFGLLGSAPPAGAKDEREGLVFIGLFGLALSTIWLFLRSIDWSTWNAIKEVATGTRAAGDEAESKSDDR